MSEPEIQFEIRRLEGKIVNKYTFLSRLFLVLSILFIIFIGIIFIGVFIFNVGHNWALFSLDSWLLVVSVIFAIFIVFNLIFYFHFTSVRNKRIELEKPKPEFIDGKKVHVYTYPQGVEGGIFSKTYIELDGHNILRLRTLMIPPEDLWK
jgi:hypothetical protein